MQSVNSKIDCCAFSHFNNFFFGRSEEVVKGENVEQDHRFQSIGLTHTHVFNPTTTGEFRFGFGRRRMLVDFLDPSDNPPIIRWTFTGFSPIIGHSGRFLSAAQRVAPEFGKTTFLVGSGSGGQGNVVSVDASDPAEKNFSPPVKTITCLSPVSSVLKCSATLGCFLM